MTTAVVMGQDFMVRLDKDHAHNLKELSKLYGTVPSSLSSELLTVAIDSHVQMFLLVEALTKVFVCGL